MNLRCDRRKPSQLRITIIAALFQDKLRSYILACQDEETGGFADRPGDMVRVIIS